MKNREELINQSVEKFRAVQTLDDIKASKDELVEVMKELFKSAVDSLREYLENMESYSEEERSQKFEMFQDESFMLPPAIGKEMERLDAIPGGNEYLEEFSDDMEQAINPHIEEYSALAGQLMDRLMGGLVGGMEDLMGGMAEAMGGIVGGMADVMNDTAETVGEDEFVFDYDNPNTPRMLYELYAARSLDQLDKDLLIDDLEEQMQNDIWELETLTDESFGGPQEDDMERISEMRKRNEVFVSEMEKEFKRLGEKSGDEDKAMAVKKEVLSKLSLKVQEIKHYLAQLK